MAWSRLPGHLSRPRCPPPILCEQIEQDEEAKKALEWVREMYAFSIACALEKVELDLKVRRPPATTKCCYTVLCAAELG